MTRVLPSLAKRGRFLFNFDAAYSLAAPEQSLDAVTGQPATFARAAVKSAIDANLAVRTVPHSLPAFQWALNPVTGLYEPGVLLENAATNLALWSQDYTQAVWSKANVTVSPNYIVGPDGFQTVDQIIETAANAEHYVDQQMTGVANNAVVAHSVSVSRLSSRAIQYVSLVKKDGATVFGARFDLSTGTVTSTDAGITARIKQQANGFYRLTVVGNVGAGASQPAGRTQPLVGGLSVYLGSTGSAQYYVDSQFEVVAATSCAETSRIVTGAATVTRPGETISWPFNFLPAPMTFYFKGVNLGGSQIGAATGNNPYYAILGAAPPSYFIVYTNTKSQVIFTAGGVSSVAVIAGALPAIGDGVELIGQLASTGSVDIQQSLNGAAATGSTGAGTGQAFPTAWTAATLLANAGDVGNGIFLLQKFRIAAGVQTLAFMQAG